MKFEKMKGNFDNAISQLILDLLTAFNHFVNKVTRGRFA